MIHTPEEFARAVLNITAGNVTPSPVDIHHAAGLVAARDAAIRAATTHGPVHPPRPGDRHMTTDLPRTVITLTGDRGPLHVAKGVLVNGSPVTVAEHGVDIDFGPNEVTTVTLRLLADEVHFVKEAPTGPTPPATTPEYVEDVDAYPMACGRCWGVHPVGACDR